MISAANGIGVGMNSDVSRRMGADDTTGAGKATGNAITLGIICSVLMLLFGLFGAEPFFSISTNDTEIMGYGVQ